jgi:hypothetical protein
MSDVDVCRAPCRRHTADTDADADADADADTDTDADTDADADADADALSPSVQWGSRGRQPSAAQHLVERGCGQFERMRGLVPFG